MVDRNKTIASGLRGLLNQPVEQAQPASPLGSTAEAGRVLGVKGTGKAAAPGTGPSKSAIGERAAVATGEQRVAEIQQKAATTQQAITQQAGQEADKQAQARASLDAASYSARIEMLDQAEKLAADLERRRGQMDTREYANKLRQVAFMTGLTSTDTIHKLRMSGKRYRFEQGLTNNRELLEAELSDLMEVFEVTLEESAITKSLERKFTQEIASMDLDAAMKMASQNASATNQAMIYNGINSMAQGSMQFAADDYKAAHDKDADTKSIFFKEKV